MPVYAIIIAGGNGERLWPLSTPERPKQFVSLFENKSLIRHAVDRLVGFVPPERIIVITAERLVAMTRRVLPHIPKVNIIGEPCRRDTAAAVAVACGLVRKLGGEKAVGCILTADQLMTPETKFKRTLMDSVNAARKSTSIVTMGIVPEYPATGFGYVECAEVVDVGTKTEFHKVKRFVEKPDVKTARKYLRTGRFYWNSGMFIWQAKVMSDAFMSAAPDIGVLIEKVVKARSVTSILKKEYPTVRSISFDYAVMEKINNILVAKSDFTWDDVGSWIAIENHFPKDAFGNVCLGKTKIHNVANSIVVGSDNHITALVGVKDIVVVHTDGATLVCAKNSVQDVKKLLR